MSSVDTKITGGNGKPWGCAPATLQLDLSGKTYAVTGGNGGIGFEVTKQLAKQGAKVLMCSRSKDKADAAIANIVKEVPNALVEFIHLDLNDLKTVRACAATINEKYTRLDGLVNNAGIMAVPKGKTKDGFEKQLGVNHLGPFLLTHNLLPLLKSSAPSRIINTSSCAHSACNMLGSITSNGHIDLEDLMFENRKYTPEVSYAQSKLANIVHANHLAKMMTDEKVDVTVVSLHPGWAATNLARASTGSFGIFLQNKVLTCFMKNTVISPFQGAATTLHCLLHESVPAHNGAFYSQVGLYTDKTMKNGGWPLKTTHPEGNDPALAQQFYEVSLKLVEDKGL